jgi:hypothetical protein
VLINPIRLLPIKLRWQLFILFLILGFLAFFLKSSELMSYLHPVEFNLTASFGRRRHKNGFDRLTSTRLLQVFGFAVWKFISW